MNIVERLANLLAEAFLYYAHPKRHDSWEYPKGSEVVVVTVSIIKKIHEPMVLEIGQEWVIPEKSYS